ncbi:hypothetical protein N7537_010029 [Penicillium hordei]|uniref:Rhodopsin domain-containing protein n=1 Tax=Penicillium hordei TaxID=40994 RepID=A0AAD6DUM1_9EURO|nr:uncharacterized protein N7537_010029 [Penicillium hordei]KAJ5593125.1 hypothetical protein N7537_010029 [Penicillium hordei]
MPIVGRSLAIFMVSIVMMCISTVMVALRTFVRLYILQAFGWDDALMVVALILFICLDVCSIIGAMNGVGHTYTDFTSIDIYRRALLLWWLGQMLYIWASAVAKISIAVALLRLAVRRSYRVMIWSIIAVIIAVGLMLWLVLLFACNPISHFWQQVNPMDKGTCLSMYTILGVTYFYSSVTILCDVSLSLLPIFLVWNLQMNSRTKLAVGGILGLGSIASVAVICRLPVLPFYATGDFLYSTYQIAIWSIVETCLGITAGSLITLRPLFRWFLDGNSAHNHTSSHQGTYSWPYPLSDLQNEPMKTSRSTNHWRPDLDPDDARTIVTVSSQRRNKLHVSSSSQEALYPEPRTPNRVTVQTSFIQTVTEGSK